MALSGLTLSYIYESNVQKIKQQQIQLANDSLPVKNSIEDKIPKSGNNSIYNNISGNSALKVQPLEPSKPLYRRRQKQTDTGQSVLPDGSTAQITTTTDVPVSSKTPANAIKELENLDKLKNE